MKILLLVIDGLGDRPTKALGGKTPLEAARKPNLDFLAQQGMEGSMTPVFSGDYPTSKDSHLSLFGYDVKKNFIARGVFEAVGMGFSLKKGDIAFRGNFATVSENLKILDRRAGRIDEKQTQKFLPALNGLKIKGIKFFLRTGSDQRVAVIMRGKGLSEKITDGDFHKIGIIAPRIKPKNRTQEAIFTASVVNEFLKKTSAILSQHPLNQQRAKKGLLIANYILLREPGFARQVPSFKKVWGKKACCIAGGKMYQGIGKVLGMDLIKVKGANGEANTNIEGKFKAAKNALAKYDFVYCHIKAVDNFAHDGDCFGKKKMIEKIDKHLKILFNLKNALLIITADHSTPCLAKKHTKDSVPVLVVGRGSDNSKTFSEKACRKGKIGKIKNIALLKIFW